MRFELSLFHILGACPTELFGWRCVRYMLFEVHDLSERGVLFLHVVNSLHMFEGKRPLIPLKANIDRWYMHSIL